MYQRFLNTVVGSVFNRWSIIDQPFRQGRYTLAQCLCTCGSKKIVNVHNIVNGFSKSCGCWDSEVTAERNFKHGDSVRGERRRLYTTWAGMIQRCTNPNAIGYKYWGGCGIKIFKSWYDYPTFKKWALKSGYNDTLTIERKNINEDYKPSNCIWIPRTKQNRNRRDTRFITAFGETKGIADWFEDKRCKVRVFSTLVNRLFNLDWPPEEALFTPKCNKWSRQSHSHSLNINA